MPTRRRAIFVTGTALLVLSLIIGLQIRSAFGVGATSRDEHSIGVAGRSRTYFLHLPAGYDGKHPLPLVLVLHGAIQGAAGIEHMSGMSAKADAEHFIAVYPEGTGLAPTWNSGNCCGYALRNRVDDVQFLRQLIANLEQHYAVDPRRIFITGISNGAMMSYRAACEMSDVVAAIAPVEGAQDLDCHPASPVSVVVVHGTADRLVPFDGGVSDFRLGPARKDASVADAIFFWTKADSCDSAAAQHLVTKDLVTDIYSECHSGTDVVLYAVQGGHHTWPGSRFSGNGVPATDLIWTFFSEHPKL